MAGKERQEQKQQQQSDMQLMQLEAERLREWINQLPNKQCPRCYSMDTKFSYFNNNKLSQERYLCKTCKRHWTHGGTLKNVPEGSAVRKSRTAKASTSLGVGGGPSKVTRVNSFDKLFGFITGQHRASGSYIPEAPVISGNVNNLPYAHNSCQGFSTHPITAVVGARNHDQSQEPVQRRGMAYEHNFDQGLRAHQNNHIGNSAISQAGGSYKNIPQAPPCNQPQLNTANGNVSNLSYAQEFTNGLIPQLAGLHAHNHSHNLHQKNSILNFAISQDGGSYENIPQEPAYNQPQLNTAEGNVSNLSCAQGLAYGLTPHMAGLQGHNQGQDLQHVQQRGQVYQDNSSHIFMAHQHTYVPQVHNLNRSSHPVQPSGQFYQHYSDQGYGSEPSDSNATVTGTSSSHNGVTSNENNLWGDGHNNSNNQLS